MVFIKNISIMKICIICKEHKQLSEYYKHPDTTDWYLTKCKECQKRNSRETRSKEKDKARYKRNPKKRLQVIFLWMMNRCYNKKNNHYKWYWLKWVEVEWQSFKEFYNDMFESYILHYNQNHILNRNTQIDRIDNEWNYNKSNCKWVTAKENNQYNKRKSLLNSQVLLNH